MKGLTMTLQELIDLDRPTLLTHIEKALSKQESVVFGGYRYQVDDIVYRCPLSCVCQKVETLNEREETTDLADQYNADQIEEWMDDYDETAREVYHKETGIKTHLERIPSDIALEIWEAILS